MKIGIQTWGSEGDVRPLLALAAGLRMAGNEVTLAVTHVANKDYAPVGAQFGVPVRQAGRVSTELAKFAGEALAGERDMLKQTSLILRNLLEPAAEDMLAEAKRLCRENDLVIGHFLVHPLRTAAELAGRPCISVFLAPLLPSATFPPPGIPHLGSIMNSLMWKAGGVLVDRMFLPAVNRMRLAEGLRPLRNVMRGSFRSPRLNLVASSPALFPPPADWDETIQLCGAFHLPEQWGVFSPPAELRRFLGDGPPPVYMTIGSMSIADPLFGETVRMFADAARHAQCRAIIQSDGQVAGAQYPDVLLIDRAEHHLVFPHCAAVVHHGGAGTTHAASRAGCPSIIVEYVTDQAFWGGVLHRLGIAPPVLHRRTVTATTLGNAIRAALGSREMRERARAMGERMRGERGVERAVEVIQGQRW